MHFVTCKELPILVQNLRLVLKGDDGKCLAKPEPEDKDIWGACGIFKDQGRCNMRYVCHGFFQRLFPDIVRAKVHTPTTRCFVMA